MPKHRSVLIVVTVMKKRIIITLCFVYLFFVSLPGQERQRIAQTIGGSGFKDEVLESALIWINYERTRAAIKDESQLPIMLIDTVLLAVGPTCSVFLDPEMLARHARWGAANMARSKKASVMKAFELQPVNQVRHLMVNGTDYYEAESGEESQVYTYHNSGIVTSCLLFSAMQCQEKIEAFSKWSIESDTLSILGHNCQKASVLFAGRKYTAWFALDIPVGDGPWKFWGLPGLIMHVEDEDKVICFEAIEMGNYDNAVIVRETELDNVNLRRYNEEYYRQMENINIGFLYNGECFFAFKHPFTLIRIEQ